jgi:hypothetical protein
MLAMSLLTSLSFAGDRKELQQPLAPSSKLECWFAHCLSLSTTVLVSDACYRTCVVACGGQFQGCVGRAWVNNCRAQSDGCDLSCQKHCRAYGGPLLDLTQ